MQVPTGKYSVGLNWAIIKRWKKS